MGGSLSARSLAQGGTPGMAGANHGNHRQTPPPRRDCAHDALRRALTVLIVRCGPDIHPHGQLSPERIALEHPQEGTPVPYCVPNQPYTRTACLCTCHYGTPDHDDASCADVAGATYTPARRTAVATRKTAPKRSRVHTH